MRVNIVGFQMELGKAVTLPYLYQLFESSDAKETKFYSDKYLYFTDIKDNYIVGLVLRFKKDKKHIATHKNENGDLVVDISKLGTDEENTEVSLFCINPESMRGLYYSYVGCLSSSVLKTTWKVPHDLIKNAKIKSLIDEYSEFGKKDRLAAKKKAVNECSGHFNLKVLVTPADINTIISQYSEIKSIEINSQSAFEESGKYSPTGDFIKKGKVEMLFENIVINANSIKMYIKKLVTDTPSKSDIIRLRGKLIDGEEKTFVVGENIDSFGHYEFDKFVELLPKGLWKDYTDCAAMDKLIYIMKNKDAVFGSIPSNNDWRLESAKTANEKLQAVS
ncbi:MAG: hypothetical protein ACI83B_003009 [Sediminicola sp.]|jgi:hypothetical protein